MEFASTTETHERKEFLGIQALIRGQNVKVVARANSNAQGLEILVDSAISLDITATYERSDGTVQPWTRHLAPGKHTIHLP